MDSGSVDLVLLGKLVGDHRLSSWKRIGQLSTNRAGLSSWKLRSLSLNDLIPFATTSNGLQPKSDGLRPTSFLLQLRSTIFFLVFCRLFVLILICYY